MFTRTVVIIYFVGLAFLLYLFYAAYSSIREAREKEKSKVEAQKES